MIKQLLGKKKQQQTPFQIISDMTNAGTNNMAIFLHIPSL